MATTTSCPHCGAANPSGSAFCESCGKALATSSGGPRIVRGNVMPSSRAGQRLMGDELHKLMKRASNTLLGLGIVLAIIGIAIMFFASKVQRSGNELAILGGVNIALGLIFIGLYFWARKSPLPASIVGLALYGTLVVANVVMWFQASGNGEHPTGSPIGILQIIIIAALCQGIQAGVKYRQLLKSGTA